ncbi:MAG: hypothetical protein KTR31_34880 [Myxococcales bacterium]|nr:hypothetical protein [Myxococcales bacterium]
MTTFLLALLLGGTAHAQTSVQDFRLGGSAQVLDQECIRLTPDTQYVTGSAWFHKSLDLQSPFEMKLSVMLGAKDQEGADGIAFVFHPGMRTGFRGEGMGFGGLSPSIGIELDTYRNVHLSDPFADHLALRINGDAMHLTSDPTVVELPNLEDGRRHPLRIVWTPKGGLKVYLDDALRASFPAELVRSTFGGETVVNWGMTAATGRLSNNQDVCIEQMFIGV